MSMEDRNENMSLNKALEAGRDFAGTLMVVDSSPEVLEAAIIDFIKTYQLLVEDDPFGSASILLDNYFFPPLRVLTYERCFDRDLNLFLNIFTDDVILELKKSELMDFLTIFAPGIAADVKCVEKNAVMRRLQAFDFDADSCSLANLSFVDGFDRLTKRTEQRLENILIVMLRRMFGERKLLYGKSTDVEEFITKAQGIYPDSLNDRIGYYCGQLGSFEDITECEVRRFDLPGIPFGVVFKNRKNRRTGDKVLSVKTQLTIGVPFFQVLSEREGGRKPLNEYTFDYNGGVAERIAEGIWKRICAVQDDES